MIRDHKALLSPTPRELAATLFRRGRLVAVSFAIVLLSGLLFTAFSARYESHFKVLLRRGRFDPVEAARRFRANTYGRPSRARLRTPTTRCWAGSTGGQSEFGQDRALQMAPLDRASAV